MPLRLLNNIEILNNYVKELSKENTIDYAGISSFDNFKSYEEIIKFKYKMINNKKQLSKICDFITEYKPDYDWYIKIRPEIQLHCQFSFNNYLDTCINSRARQYSGPKIIEYGCSCNGIGFWSNIGDISYSSNEDNIIIDDQIYIFSQKLIEQGIFNKIEPYTDKAEHEWIHTNIWKSRGAKFNIIGINCMFIHITNQSARSGNINC